MDFQDVSEYMRLSKDAVELLKSGWKLLPKGRDRDEIENKIEAAEKLLKENDAKLAKDLGYRLCRCNYPPEIMLWNKDARKNICPKCGDIYPPDNPDVKIDRGESRMTWARRGR